MIGAVEDPTLDGIRFIADDASLRDRAVDPDKARARRDELVAALAALPAGADPGRRARLLGLRTVLSRVLGDLDDAALAGEQSLRAAQQSGDAGAVVVAMIRLAHVRQWRGELNVADTLFGQALSESGRAAPAYRSFALQHSGKNAYEQRRYEEAARWFAAALQLRELEGDDELIASSRQALRAAERRLGR